MIETKMMTVTPALAREWLERNTINRPLRPSVVRGLVNSYVRGEHRVTHQGLAFCKSGELLDGQHRLTAIAEMPSTFQIQMLVTSGLDREAFEAIDIGIRRSPADVLKLSQGLVGVARFFAAVIETSKASLTPQYIQPFALSIMPTYERLVGFCPKHTKAWSSSSVRAAAVIQMMDGKDHDYVMMTYHSLNHAEFDTMPRIAQSLYRQHVRGLVSTKTLDIYCRAFKAFDPANGSIDKLQISDTAGIMVQTRELIRQHIIGNAQKKAAVVFAAKKVNGANSTRKIAA